VWTKGTSTTVESYSASLTIDSPGTYNVTATDAHGCIDKASKDGKEAIISANIKVDRDKTQCLGETITLSTQELATDVEDFTWFRNGVQVGTSPTFAATQSGVYEVKLVFGSNPLEQCEKT